MKVYFYVTDNKRTFCLARLKKAKSHAYNDEIKKNWKFFEIFFKCLGWGGGGCEGGGVGIGKIQKKSWSHKKWGFQNQKRRLPIILLQTLQKLVAFIFLA